MVRHPREGGDPYLGLANMNSACAGMTNESTLHFELQLTEQACNGYWEF